MGVVDLVNKFTSIIEEAMNTLNEKEFKLFIKRMLDIIEDMEF